LHPSIAGFRPALTALLAACALALAPALAAPALADPSGFPTLDRAAGDTVVAWGDNSYGQTSVPPGLSGVVQVAVGGQHTLALKSDGTVVAWGDNSAGQTSVPPGLTNVIQVAAGERFSAALKSDGTVTAWGDNSYGQTNIDVLGGATQIAAGANHLLVILVGAAVGYGDNSAGQIASLGMGAVQAVGGQSHSLVLRHDNIIFARGGNTAGQRSVPGISGLVTQLAAGFDHSLALKSDSTVVAWGGSGNQPPAGLDGVVQIAAGKGFSLALRYDGTVTAWGGNVIQPPAGLANVVQVAAGNNHAAAIVRGQTRLVAWGQGSGAQLPADLGAVTQVAAGLNHALALRPDGTVAAWGNTTSGKLNVPTDIKEVRQIAAGLNHSVVLDARGRVRAWGDNSQGQSSVPPDLNSVRQIAAGGFHTLALRATGTVVGWGNSSAAAVPPGLDYVNQVAAGFLHSVAVLADGKLVVWGENNLGQLELRERLTFADYQQVAAGNNHSLALSYDGTVTAWGDNRFGQTNVPAGLADVVRIVAGGNLSAALKADGTAVVWGDTGSGVVTVPADLGDVAQLAVGGDFALALMVDQRAPDTRITAGPMPLNNSTTAEISFEANDLSGVAGFACSFNGAPFAACVSPQRYSGLSEGSYTFRVRAGDRLGNLEQSPAELSWTVDLTPPPAPTIAAPTNGALLNTNRPTLSGSAEPFSTVTISFQESGFPISTTTADAAGNWLFTPISVGNGVYALTAHAADRAGNIGPAAAGVTFTVDTVRPGVTLARAPDQANPANTAPIRFIASFSEPVSGFTTSDLQLSGTAGPSAVALSERAPFDGTSFAIEVSGMTSAGSVMVAIPAGAAADSAGNANTFTSAGAIYDPIAPTATFSTTVGALTNAADIPVALRLSELVSGFPIAGLEIVNGTIGPFSSAGLTYNFIVTPLADGVVIIRLPAGAVTDLAGNPVVAAELIVTSDRTAPSIILAPAPDQASPAAGGPIRFAVSFSEPVSGLTQDDLQLGGAAGPSDAALSELAPFDGTRFAVEVTGMSGPGAVTLGLLEGAAADAAGNPSSAAGANITFSPDAPVVTGIAALDPSPTNAAGVRYRVTFSEPVSGVDAADFALVTDLSGAAVSAVSGGGADWTVSVDTGNGDGSLRLDLADDNSISGALGVPLGGAGAGDGTFSAGEVYTLDRTAPTASLVAPPQVQRGAASATFAVDYADNLALLADSLGTGTVRVSGPGGFSRIAALVSLAPGGEGGPRQATYRIDAPAGGWAAGSYTITLVAGQVSDTAGNRAAAAQLGGFAVTEEEEETPRFTIYLPALMRWGFERARRPA
jgi:alpha-tubulin suppressor-like RCC1 family protein